MLKTQFEFTNAVFASVEDISLDEASQADLITIQGLVPGGIYHSASMRWLGSLEGCTQPEEFIRSKKEKKAVRETMREFANLGFELKTVPVTESLYHEFTGLYQNTTLKRERPLQFDLKSFILGRIRVETPIFLSGLFKDGLLHSGLVFSVYRNEAVVSFGAKQKISHRRGGIGGVLEYELIRFCLAEGIETISHGRSHNPAGIFGSAGIFEFKSRYGFSAYPEGSWQTTFIKRASIALSDLVFVSIVDNQIGYVVVTNEEEKAVLSKYKTRAVKQIQVISTKTAESTCDRWLTQLFEPVLNEV